MRFNDPLDAKIFALAVFMVAVLVAFAIVVLEHSFK